MIQIETTSHDPFFNQAFEDYVFRTYREGDVLLLWRNRPAVVVGCYQNICREVHVRALLDIVAADGEVDVPLSPETI